MSNKKSLFSGVLVPVLTPFSADLQADAGRFARFCHGLLVRGAGGLAVFGTTSEANSLSVDERQTLLEALLENSVPAVRLMPGTGCCALPDSVHLTRHAVAHGCAGVLVLPPFYYKNVSDEGLFASYSELIQRVGDARLKVYLYHIPQLTGVPLTFGVIERLLKTYPDTVTGIKDSSGNWDNTVALLRHFPGLAIFPSSESRLLEALRLGGAGCISASANINVAAIAKLAAGWQTPQAEPLHQQVSAVRAAVEAHPLVPALKAIMAHYTDDRAWHIVRPPLAPLSTDQRVGLLEKLQALGFTLAI